MYRALSAKSLVEVKGVRLRARMVVIVVGRDGRGACFDVAMVSLLLG